MHCTYPNYQKVKMPILSALFIVETVAFYTLQSTAKHFVTNFIDFTLSFLTTQIIPL